MNREQLITACRLLGKTSPEWQTAEVHCTPLAADGSTRKLYRLCCRMKSCVAILPAAAPHGMDEAVSAAALGRHLFGRTGLVPEVLGFSREHGILLFEDLGDVRLFDLVETQGWSEPIQHLYAQVIRALARLQVKGAQGLQTSCCWEGPRYDRQLMLERESGYFARALCQDLLGLEVSKEVQAEFCRLAVQAAAAPATFFLHRDCQSRNIMVHQGTIRFIDFQGGRLGPPGYDLAALLLDPYVAMPVSLQEELFELHAAELERLAPGHLQSHRATYPQLRLQRNLQILGAFAFLSHCQGKPFFARYLRPGLDSLMALLAKPECAGYPALLKLARTCRSILEKR
ncbi:MAG: aminoglycoside phosphotransferase [Deltaproteobacteria bacterium]|nr:MAG: aminoglycoside phosphotransferase [Deltaproteobacteria bacterium]